MKQLIVGVVATLCLLGTAITQAAEYAVAKVPTPVLNVPDFQAVFGGKDGQTLHANTCGLVKEIEYIAYSGTVFTIHQKMKSGRNWVYNITTDEYPKGPGENYYIDSRFVDTRPTPPTPRPRVIPGKKEVLSHLQATAGNVYIWGGDVKGGVPEMVQYYPPQQSLASNADLHKKWTLDGYDCSGILFEATNGATPRNTSGLVAFGEAVPIAGLTAKQIARTVKPLDLIVWKGHVMIVVDNKHLIESRADYDDVTDGCQDGGVKIRPLQEVLTRTMTTRIPVNRYDDPVPEGKKKFVIRRWHPES